MADSCATSSAALLPVLVSTALAAATLFHRNSSPPSMMGQSEAWYDVSALSTRGGQIGELEGRVWRTSKPMLIRTTYRRLRITVEFVLDSAITEMSQAEALPGTINCIKLAKTFVKQPSPVHIHPALGQQTFLHSRLHLRSRFNSRRTQCSVMRRLNDESGSAERRTYRIVPSGNFDVGRAASGRRQSTTT